MPFASSALASAAGLQATIEHIEQTQPALLFEVVNVLMRKPMQLAKYFAKPQMWGVVPSPMK